MRIAAVVALALGVALLAPARAWAPIATEYIIIVGLAATGDAATLGLSINSEDAARPFGSVRLGHDVLLPRGDGSSAQFADANGNGDAGLTLAEIALADVRTGRPALATLRPAAGEDIDATGRHAGTLDLCVGSDCTRLDVELRAVVNAFR